MTDYADLEKRLRDESTGLLAMAGSEAFTVHQRRLFETLGNQGREAADALASLTSRLTLVRAVIEGGGGRIGLHGNPDSAGNLCEHGLFDFQECVGCYDEHLLAALEGRDLSSVVSGKDS